MSSLRATAAVLAAVAGIGLFTHVAPAEGQSPSPDRASQVSRVSQVGQDQQGSAAPAAPTRTVGVRDAVRTGRVASISAR